ncbi:hypothetical protein AAG906_028447 [Vitis piasezkii]
MHSSSMIILVRSTLVQVVHLARPFITTAKMVTWSKLKVMKDKYKNLLLAILISSYFKIFLIAMMVWELPSSVIFIIDVFVLSSNTVALKGQKYFLSAGFIR